ncbi:MAG: MerR family transcriptional regulator [Bacteroidales bacterium]|jgi:DNA-binding transcriptional MerR regulator|nr:MerR family transcriptional regulator [Bacteroidales bacterium]
MENGQIEKQYFTIGETAAMFEVKVHTIRFWESEFDAIQPYRNEKGTRFYTKKDIETIRTIQYLTKTKGYTLQGAKQALQKNGTKETNNAQIMNTLENIKSFLINIKEAL